eukprot:m.230504 g.230504  ORF g.230504 m.230504 type:complete len:583 (-) comp12072_c0_seq1:84-1832(-)
MADLLKEVLVGKREGTAEQSAGSAQDDASTDKIPPALLRSVSVRSNSPESHGDVPTTNAEAVTKRDEHEDSSDDDADIIAKEGVLSKWTNYYHGWQDRYLVLKGRNLSYYKDKEDKESLCRGTIDISKGIITKHEFDHSRFAIAVGTQIFYLRATSEAQRQEWLDVFDDVLGKPTLTRRPSTLSLASITSVASKGRNFPEKLAEMKTFRDLLATQVSSLQSQLSGASVSNGSPTLQLDALALKSTSAALLETLGGCIDLMAKREEDWERRCEKLTRKKKRLEEQLRSAQEAAAANLQYSAIPDYNQDPTAVMKEDEFYDALETGLDELGSQAEREQMLIRLENEAQQAPMPVLESHRFSSFLDRKVRENLDLAMQDPKTDAVWEMVHQDGEMKVYRREVEDENKVICDRLKAFHVVQGVTARELCNYFFDTKYRMEWEHTLEKFFVLERFNPATLIFHNLHKRIWPSAQRDSCCLSHIRDLGDNRWMVQNISVDHDSAPKDKLVRVDANILMLVSTVVTKPASGPIKREHVSAHITYLAYVNPGGWVPPAALKALSKREYPKFLRTFSSQSLKHFSDKPIQI